MTGLEEDGMFHDVGGVIRFVDTYFVHTHDQFYDKFKGFILDGYEGAMLRNTEGVYRQNYRSADLQKYKEFQEDEYDIVGFTQGDGRDEGTVIWICITEQGRRFSVRPKGSVEYRRELYENAGRYVGKRLTVIFQELTEFGVPRFPVGKCVREMGI
jgi:DNA ligase-1